MTLLSPQAKKAVLRLTVHDDRTNDVVGEATGFWYVHSWVNPSSGNSHSRSFAVSCKHVLRDCQPSQPIHLRHNLSPVSRGSNILQLISTAADWYSHPTEDVAVCPTGLVEGYEFDTLAYDSSDSDIVTRANAERHGITEGDEVYILGYPIGYMAGSRDYPVVRGGMIGQIQGWIDGEHSTFLVSGSVFPGNSGSIVLTKPQFAGLADLPRPRLNHLIGMISAYKTVSLESNLPGLAQNADLAVVVPMDAVNETVQQYMETQHQA